MNLWSGQNLAETEESDNLEWSVEAKVLIGQRLIERRTSVIPASFAVARQLVGTLDAKPGDMRRALIVAGHLDMNATARRLIEKLQSLDRTDEERDFDKYMQNLYLSDMPEIPDEEFLSSLQGQVGWMAEIVEADALMLSGAKGGAAARDRLHKACYLAYFTSIFVTLAGSGASILGLILLTTAIVNLRRGRLRIHAPVVPVRASLGFETFALYLLYLVLVMVTVSIFKDESARSMGAGSLAIMIVALFLLAWPMLRGARFGQVLLLAGLHRGQGFLREIASGIVGYLAFVPLLATALVVQAMLMRHFGYSSSSVSHPYGPELVGTASVAQRVMLLVMAIVIAPLVEEIFFRGFFYIWLRAHSGVVVAALLSGLLFASLHPQGVLGIPVLWTIGFSLAMLRQWRGSLIAPIVAHALINGTSSLILLLVM